MKVKIALGLLTCVGALLVSACSSGASGTSGSEGGTGGGTGGGSAQGGGGSTSSAGGGSAQGGSSAGGTSAQGGSGAGGSPAQGGTGGGSDPFEANRVACVNKINAYRATKGLPELARWKDAEACVDQEASEDAMTGTAHGAWLSGKYPCNGAGQNECPGWGADGIEACLDSMWGEKDQPGCSGCDQCNDSYNPDCPNCDFYGQKSGNVCGHYANMIAKYVTKVACGFSAQGGWDAINFE